MVSLEISKSISSLATAVPYAILIFSNVSELLGVCRSGVVCPCFLQVKLIFFGPKWIACYKQVLDLGFI